MKKSIIMEAIKEGILEFITQKYFWYLVVGVLLTLFNRTDEIGFLIIGFAMAKMW